MRNIKTLFARDFEGKYKIHILYEDDFILVIDKPAGILSIPDHWNKEKKNMREVLNRYVQKEQGLEQIYVVHRLDKETSGVMIFAKNAQAHKKLNIAFQEGNVHKNYLALISGHLKEKEGVIDAPISRKMIKGGRKFIDEKKGLPSQTHYKVLEEFRLFSLVEAKPITGRMHQIRLHFSYIGHPLAIDTRYHNKDKNAIYITDIKKGARIKRDQELRPIMNRLTLHASTIEFEHPETGASMMFKADLPKDFRSLLSLLQKWNKME